MERTLANETPKKTGEKVRLCGWVDRRRDHGKLVFIDLRDRSGVVQIVGKEKLGKLRIADVIEVEGTIKKRPRDLVNLKLATGKIEVKVEKIKILAQSEDLPFDIRGDGYQIGEEVRLQYRYLDLRRPRLVRNLELRHKMIKFIRNWLDEKGFIEIETPLLTKSTPEGARDFIVPSRLQPGKFYALPQSPQQYKQLLMVAGFEKYYQIARCIRDEDLRADRQLEFTQLDLEMSFVEREDVLALIEELMIDLSKEMEKKVFKKPFPRIGYQKAIEKYGDDKFDLRDKKERNILAFAFVIDQPLFEWKKEEKRWDAMHHPFTAPNPKDISLLKKGKVKQVRSWQYDLVCNGAEVGGGSIRITDPKIQTKVFEMMGHTKDQVRKKFGHLLKAFEYGVPPHGGIALGLDRLVAIFAGEESIREAMAFPVTSSGQTSVMDAPSEVDEGQLEELGISVSGKKKVSEEIFKKIIKLLKNKKIQYQLYNHKPVYTSENSARVRGTKVEQGAKALVMMSDKKPIMVIISAAKKVDSKKFKQLFKVRDLRMCTANEVNDLTKVKIGAVPPFGSLFNLETFVDRSLGENKEIVFNAGLHTKSIKMKYEDWVKLEKPKKGDFSS